MLWKNCFLPSNSFFESLNSSFCWAVTPWRHWAAVLRATFLQLYFVKLQWSRRWEKESLLLNVAAENKLIVLFVTSQQLLHKHSLLACFFNLCGLQQSEESFTGSQPCRLQQQQCPQLCLRSPHRLSCPALLLLHPHPRRPLQWESYQTCTGLACWTCRETGLSHQHLTISSVDWSTAVI